MSVTLSATGEELRRRFLALRTRRDVADLLDIDESLLIYHLYIAPTHKRYKSFEIAKRSGAKRRIDAPATTLKIIQRKLHQVLQHIYQVKPSVHGFVQGKSIHTNARTHLRRYYLLNVDLENFFPSINFGRVRGMFMARPYNLNAEVATVLAQICCYDNRLPQGAPTSPTVSNMICAKLDNQLQKLAQQHNCLYTRYADDISISTHNSSFPRGIARFSRQLGRYEVGPALSGIIESNGFRINPAKVYLHPRSRRQQVTGIVVNRRTNVRRVYINRVRAMLHAWEKYGLIGAETVYRERYDAKSRLPMKHPVSFSKVVQGKVEYIGMVRGTSDSVYRKMYADYCRIAGVRNRWTDPSTPTPLKWGASCTAADQPI